MPSITKALARGNAYHSWPLLSDFFVVAEPAIQSDNPAEWDYNLLNLALSNYQFANGVTYAPVIIIPESSTQVTCTDARDIRDQLITAAEELAYKNASRIGGYTRLSLKIRRTEWQIRPSCEWYGPVGGPTTTPIIFAGNSLDPITPFENAQKARTFFKGAMMFYVDEIGHTLFNTRNTCGLRMRSRTSRTGPFQATTVGAAQKYSHFFRFLRVVYI
ncbi:hypothetical protein H072_7754 [Dactylellina haptotyla CBS 200.50]|uniref:Peptidase S33 tripeptidyl aminopeptidase-like C-terminal domain-containing protein n=1 Tax=Dactylellina haptotyla (strain CBS 200.50) TaxID=1284197 RepID=S8A677_DACHA|nr:hypothetical protein H072_7754 [Dactylellina haptotyla CBS 200.50]